MTAQDDDVPMDGVPTANKRCPDPKPPPASGQQQQPVNQGTVDDRTEYKKISDWLRNQKALLDATITASQAAQASHGNSQAHVDAMIEKAPQNPAFPIDARNTVTAVLARDLKRYQSTEVRIHMLEANLGRIALLSRAERSELIQLRSEKNERKQVAACTRAHIPSNIYEALDAFETALMAIALPLGHSASATYAEYVAEQEAPSTKTCNTDNNNNNKKTNSLQLRDGAHRPQTSKQLPIQKSRTNQWRWVVEVGGYHRRPGTNGSSIRQALTDKSLKLIIALCSAGLSENQQLIMRVPRHTDLMCSVYKEGQFVRRIRYGRVTKLDNHCASLDINEANVQLLGKAFVHLKTRLDFLRWFARLPRTNQDGADGEAEIERLHKHFQASRCLLLCSQPKPGQMPQITTYSPLLLARPKHLDGEVLGTEYFDVGTGRTSLIMTKPSFCMLEDQYTFKTLLAILRMGIRDGLIDLDRPLPQLPTTDHPDKSQWANWNSNVAGAPLHYWFRVRTDSGSFEYLDGRGKAGGKQPPQLTQSTPVLEFNENNLLLLWRAFSMLHERKMHLLSLLNESDPTNSQFRAEDKALCKHYLEYLFVLKVEDHLHAVKLPVLPQAASATRQPRIVDLQAEGEAVRPRLLIVRADHSGRQVGQENLEYFDVSTWKTVKRVESDFVLPESLETMRRLAGWIKLSVKRRVFKYVPDYLSKALNHGANIQTTNDNDDDSDGQEDKDDTSMKDAPLEDDAAQYVEDNDGDDASTQHAVLAEVPAAATTTAVSLQQPVARQDSDSEATVTVKAQQPRSQPQRHKALGPVVGALDPRHSFPRSGPLPSAPQTMQIMLNMAKQKQQRTGTAAPTTTTNFLRRPRRPARASGYTTSSSPKRKRPWKIYTPDDMEARLEKARAKENAAGGEPVQSTIMEICATDESSDGEGDIGRLCLDDDEGGGAAAGGETVAPDHEEAQRPVKRAKVDGDVLPDASDRVSTPMETRQEASSTPATTALRLPSLIPASSSHDYSTHSNQLPSLHDVPALKEAAMTPLPSLTRPQNNYTFGESGSGSVGFFNSPANQYRLPALQYGGPHHNQSGGTGYLLDSFRTQRENTPRAYEFGSYQRGTPDAYQFMASLEATPHGPAQSMAAQQDNDYFPRRSFGPFNERPYATSSPYNHQYGAQRYDTADQFFGGSAHMPESNNSISSSTPLSYHGSSSSQQRVSDEGNYFSGEHYGMPAHRGHYLPDAAPAATRRVRFDDGATQMFNYNADQPLTYGYPASSSTTTAAPSYHSQQQQRDASFSSSSAGNDGIGTPRQDHYYGGYEERSNARGALDRNTHDDSYGGM